jgi:hypothetical protein
MAPLVSVIVLHESCVRSIAIPEMSPCAASRRLPGPLSSQFVTTIVPYGAPEVTAGVLEGEQSAAAIATESKPFLQFANNVPASFMNVSLSTWYGTCRLRRVDELLAPDAAAAAVPDINAVPRPADMPTARHFADDLLMDR